MSEKKSSILDDYDSIFDILLNLSVQQLKDLKVEINHLINIKTHVDE